MDRGLALEGYQPDNHADPAVAFRVRVTENEQEIPRHQHRKGQLIVALHGGITCEVSQAMWMVPPQYAVWLPGGMPHTNRATAQARLCFLFIEPGAVEMPEHCCALRISPLVRELILTLADRQQNLNAPATRRLVAVLFDELPRQPVEQLQLPVSEHPRIRRMVDFMARHPEQRRTLAEWAKTLAMSERSLARLVEKETGLNYRRWRHQLQLIQALRLLIGGDAVQQVARQLGYESTTAFITMFRNGMGQTPGKYLASLEALSSGELSGDFS
ncbi:AraC family transcriptional regulator [Entomohabitans teleogrylli]|uniref:AraC family transcriptional regulator n=1 Tax=Entomohabitans teleogrylli TaxID=1384589 RepID=UPI00073DB17B|nr:helix-turn-helix transcriptional regulator [Entomohabitans teleogrylli]